MQTESRIRLSKEQRQEMTQKIMNYFENERSEQIGNLSATLLLNFIVEEIGPAIYNQGIQDAYRYMTERCEDMLALEL